MRLAAPLIALAILAPTASAQNMPPAVELSTSVADGFTIAVVGDLIIAHSLDYMLRDESFASVVSLLRNADVATGNMEGHIIDGRTFVGDDGRGTGFAAEPSAAEGIATMGIDIVSRANNHQPDFGLAGMRETSRHLDAAGVQYAGFGETYAAARAAGFVTTTRGRVGMVAASPYGPSATPSLGEFRGTGGQSTLGLTRYFVVPPEWWPSVQTLRDGFPNGTGHFARGTNNDTLISLIGNSFRKAAPGDQAPYYSFEMNERDLRDILASVREGKMRSDFLTFAMHSHHFRDTKGGYRGPGIPETDDLETNSSVPDFMPELAHDVIDNGADVFQGTGVHALKGIEIYKGRPIFYGLGVFIRQDDVIGLAGRPITRDDGNGTFPVKHWTIVAVNRFEGGKLAEMGIYPVETSYEAARVAHSGIPRMAPPEVAHQILTLLQELSTPFGTHIAIEGSVGVVRP
jgi:poly-gamma-glutamate capsule biosynthesis protein CapA/YwtB (metallophosphatase superfamily)